MLSCTAGKTAAFTIPLLERIDTSKNEIQGKGSTLQCRLSSTKNACGFTYKHAASPSFFI